MLPNKLAAHVEYSSVLSRALGPCRQPLVSRPGLEDLDCCSGFLYSILWLKRMVLMTLGGELGGEGGNPWHHLLGASLNLSNVYVSCYTHMQMELYCSQLAAVSRHLPQLMGLCYCYEPTQFQFCVCCYGIVWRVDTLLKCKRIKIVLL